METPLDFLRERANDDWLLGHDSKVFLSLVEALFKEFNQPVNSSVPQKILLVEPDPIRFLAGFIAACSTGHQVFLGNPTWGESEWQQVFGLVKPDRIWENCSSICYNPLYNPPGLQPDQQNPVVNQTNGLIMIPTGGSSGRIRFAMHSWKTLMASVEGFRRYFNVNTVNSICVLPLYHVSGLMQFIRCFTSGGNLLIVPFKELKSRQWCDFDPTEFFISLVPTQLHYLLDDPMLTVWLSQCKTVFIGGAPAWPELLKTARFNRIPLTLSYGMTETASQIAALKSERFLQGNNSSGQVLPHAKVSILSPAGKLLEPNQTGTVTLQAGSLALGYYPEFFPASEAFQTDDLGFFDSQGNLNIVARSSTKIITGGENVFPSEVEAAIRATGLVKDVAVIGLPDQNWGERVTAVYAPHNLHLSPQQIQESLAGKLARFKCPKLWVPVVKLPSNEQGKVNHKQLQQIATQWQQEHAMG